MYGFRFEVGRFFHLIGWFWVWALWLILILGHFIYRIFTEQLHWESIKSHCFDDGYQLMIENIFSAAFRFLSSILFSLNWFANHFATFYFMHFTSSIFCSSEKCFSFPLNFISANLQMLWKTCFIEYWTFRYWNMLWVLRRIKIMFSTFYQTF